MKYWTLASLLVLAACGSGDGAPAGSGAASDATAAACKHPTPPKQACQARWCDNPWGVGMPCTKGGGECLDLKARNTDDGVGAVMCTAAYSDSEAFCTKPCSADDDCGEGARCVGDPENPSAGRGCMLIACAGPAPGPRSGVDAGADGGASDATATTAGDVTTTGG